MAPAHRTVKTYEQWLRRFLRFHHLRHPRQMGREEVNTFLTHLAVELQVSASRDNQALSALLFLYRELLERDLNLAGLVRTRQKRRLPVVLTQGEVRAVLERMDGVEGLIAELMYGSGLRLMEARVFPQHQRWRNNKTGGRVDTRCKRRVSTKRLPPTASAIPLPPTYWSADMTSGRFRNYWAQRCTNNDDLHPCAQSRPVRHQ